MGPSRAAYSTRSTPAEHARCRSGRDPGFERVNDGFDLVQCRVDLDAPTPPATLPGGPRFRSDAPFTGDNCGNAGGVNQDIFGIGVTFD
jgi:hypothetical protein